MSAAHPRHEATVQRGLVSVNRICVDANNTDEYLSVISPDQKPWDQHRGEADDIVAVFAASRFPHHQRYAQRIAECSRFIGFARDPPKNGKTQLKLKNARFCRVRFCAVCMWRRSLMWQARVYRALPRL